MSDAPKPDWAEIISELVIPGSGIIHNVEKRRAQVVEALWEAYLNGIREGELRHFKKKVIG